MTKGTTALFATLLILIAFGIGYFVTKQDKDPPVTDSSGQNTATEPEAGSDISVDLSGQQLTTIPDSVLSRTDITSLNLSNNQLTTLPADIAKMTNLESLNVENNRLESLPNELENMTWLKQLDISNNRLSVEQQEQLKARLPNTEIKT